MLCLFSQLFVHVVNLESGLEYYWPREKFYNRLGVMQELFNRFDDDEDDFKGDIEEVKARLLSYSKRKVLIGSCALLPL